MTTPTLSLAERAQAPDTLPALAAGGLSWRPLTLADAPALLTFWTAVQEADKAPYRFTIDEMEDELGAPWADLDRNSLVGLDADGTIRALAHLHVPAGDQSSVRVFVGGAVHPDRRGQGIGREVLAWSIARGRQVLAEKSAEPGKADLPARIAVYTEDDGPEAAKHLYLRAGLAPVRYFSVLRRDLSAPVPEITLDGSLRIVQWSEELDEPTRLAHNDSFRDHWGSEPRPAEAWTRGRSEHAPAWSFVVVDDAPDVDALLADPDTDPETAASLKAGAPLVVGYHMASRYEADWPVRGFRFGYTDILGSRRAYRGRKIAVAVLARGMRAFAEDGMEYAVLDVDTANPSGAHGLYASLGYEKTGGETAYAIEL